MDKYPLTWPSNKVRTPAVKRQRATFSTKINKGGYDQNRPVTVSEAITRIEKELSSYTRVGHGYRVPPESIIISTNLNTGVKGKPLSSLSNPDDPGAAVYFKLDGRDYCLPCDKWDRVADNLAAVAAHIGAMRGIERWGVGTSEDVYTGFKALPANAGSSNGAWWIILQLDENPDPNELRTAYRKLSSQYHPDNLDTGDNDKFIRVQMAYQEGLTQLGLNK